MVAFRIARSTPRLDAPTATTSMERYKCSRQSTSSTWRRSPATAALDADARYVAHSEWRLSLRTNAATLISKRGAGWAISNLAAITIANNIEDFPLLDRKAARVVQYSGNGRTNTLRERQFLTGYAIGFEDLIDYISTLLPRREEIGKTFREELPKYPEIILRELIANMLIHQDFSEPGTGPMVELFDNRVEITNPGRPIIDSRRCDRLGHCADRYRPGRQRSVVLGEQGWIGPGSGGNQWRPDLGGRLWGSAPG